MNAKIKKLKTFDSDRYNSIDLDRLVIYASVELDKLGIELSIENIIVGAFKLFPKKFSLFGYSEFPDATRVEKCLWRCKGNNRQWIGGKTQHGYFITDRTINIASQIEKELSNLVIQKRKNISRMRRKENILKEVINSPAYKKYLNAQKENISEADFCYLLQGTLDSSRETLKENLNSLKKFMNELEQDDILIFLNWIEDHFKNFFINK